MILEEPATTAMLAEHGHDPEVVVWWATEVECESGIARGERNGLLTGAEGTLARDRLEELRERWVEVEPAEPQRKAARRLLRTHPLRAGDALQLSAALVAAEADPAALDFLTLDERLAEAARREGFRVVTQQQV